MKHKVSNMLILLLSFFLCPIIISERLLSRTHILLRSNSHSKQIFHPHFRRTHNRNKKKICKKPAKRIKIVDDERIATDDMIVQRVHKYMWEYAERVSQRSNISLKRKLNGQLPDSYPKVMVNNARKLHQNKDLNN